MDYTSYTIEDFVTDESFIQWVKNPTGEHDAYWRASLSKHPGKEAIIKEARQIILMLSFEETRAPEGKFLEIWEKISDTEEGKGFDISAASTSHNTRGYFRSWYKIAAVFLVAVAAFAYVILKNPNTVVIQTAFGETRALFLPDSTKVTLNANSILRYASDFNERNREVWLDGEGFFAVVHKNDDRNFLVHTDELQVEVLGTRFNVNSRRGTSKVVLEEGSVKVDISQGDKYLELIMKPGELVEVSKETHQVEKRKVEVASYSSWRLNKLVFVSTPLGDIAQLLEDNYGFRVEFKDEDLKTQRFTGSTSIDNLNELKDKLNKVFGLNIQQRGNDLIFQYK